VYGPSIMNPAYKQYKRHSVLPNRDGVDDVSNPKLSRIIHYNALNP